MNAVTVEPELKRVKASALCVDEVYALWARGGRSYAVEHQGRLVRVYGIRKVAPYCYRLVLAGCDEAVVVDEGCVMIPVIAISSQVGKDLLAWPDSSDW